MDLFSTLPLESTKEWRGLFSGTVLTNGRTLVLRQRIHNFSCDKNSARANIITPKRSYNVSINNAPTGYTDEWDVSGFCCDCGSKYNKRVVIKGKELYYDSCPHMAALLLYWEQQRGIWRFTEPAELMEKRVRAEREEAERLERLKRLKREKALLVEQKEKLKGISVRPREFFPGAAPDGSFFDIKRSVWSMSTNKYCVERANALLRDSIINIEQLTLDYDDNGQQILVAVGSVEDAGDLHHVTLHLSHSRLNYHRCSCRGYYYGFYYTELCEHELVILTKLREYIRSNNPGDATDRAANNFFRELDAVSSAADDKTAAAEQHAKERRIVLSPRITTNGDIVQYSFKAGLAGGKQVILKNFRDFLNAAEAEKTFTLSKTLSIDFSELDFTEESIPWLTFIQRRVSETDSVNDRLSRKSYYTPSLSVNMRDTLSGASLDRFYDLAEGSLCEYQDTANKINTNIRVGHAKMRVILSSSRIADNDGNLIGISVTGNMPVILNGSAGSYILTGKSLSRINKDEARALRPFRAAADSSGNIRFSVGRDKLAEFYYRVIPKLTESSYVDFTDTCAEEVALQLPPEPVFTFRLDIDSDNAVITCEASVSYSDDARMLYDTGDKDYRDEIQEQRAADAVKKYFPGYLYDKELFRADYTDDTLYKILTDGISELSGFGEIHLSSEFDSNSVNPMPQLRVGVSIDSGLLELSVLSKDMSPEELLSVLDSYRSKKKYHRLKNGSFVNIAGDEQLSSIESMMDDMDLKAEDVIGKGISLPSYRALYLDSLLEKHDALAVGRNRIYRTLVKNFKTIRDADYEVPAAQEDILRPYQVYGYKWMRTLSEAGFGGILADEMGLGKTVQTIALLQALRDAGDDRPCLIVCPASLIFNWQEEFSRFAPELDVTVVSGTAAARKKKIKTVKEDTRTICVTSYDLLRQDISAYKDIRFSLAAIDEAQYIKNQKAALTKAAKAIQAEHRIALTGTPIENRLAELWSIFDFLMPGFLYGYKEFSQRFEAPIVKQKDKAATAKLKQMVSPFILRRLKMNVLKDLPPKLEEVRYTQFDPEQRKVYDGQVIHMRRLLTDSGTSGSDKIKILAELTRIRQICCDPSLIFENYSGGSAKREACMELIKNAIGGGHRMLLFSQFTSMLELIEDDLKGSDIPYYKITGSTPKETRARLVREFNEGDVPLFLISLKAGGTGLNLTGADVVIHYDPWWNVAAQNQATDRAHRIGQKNQVTVYRMIVKGTIEEKILALQESKRDLADKILSGETSSITSMSNEELLALFD